MTGSTYSSVILKSARGKSADADLSRDLLEMLARQRTVRAEMETRAPRPGERAGGVDLVGQIALTFLSSGGAVALFNCLRSLMERERSLSVRLRSPGGREVEIDATNLDPALIEKLAADFSRTAEESG